MRHTIKYELWVGIFLLLALSLLLFLSFKVVNIQGFSGSKSYKIYASFDNIGGLKPRAPLKLGGVVIGRVKQITLDQQTYLPTVVLEVDENINKIPETSSLSIKTSGLLGEQYLALNLGFDDGESDFLKNGDTISDTKSAMILEDLVGQFLYGDKQTTNPTEVKN